MSDEHALDRPQCGELALMGCGDIRAIMFPRSLVAAAIGVASTVRLPNHAAELPRERDSTHGVEAKTEPWPTAKALRMELVA